MDYRIKSYKELFRSIEKSKIIDANGTFPHTFILFGKYGFNIIITKLSSAITLITGVPVRVYILIKKV